MAEHEGPTAWQKRCSLDKGVQEVEQGVYYGSCGKIKNGNEGKKTDGTKTESD